MQLENAVGPLFARFSDYLTVLVVYQFTAKMEFSLLMRPPCLIESEANRANIQDGCQCKQCLADRMDQIVER